MFDLINSVTEHVANLTRLICFQNPVLSNQPVLQDVTSIRVELSNHPSKISSTKKRRKQKRTAVNIHNFNTFNADEVDDATLM